MLDLEGLQTALEGTGKPEPRELRTETRELIQLPPADNEVKVNSLNKLAKGLASGPEVRGKMGYTRT